jgi:2-polyprenyl-3-methyl-5-hydroxy-6-metoxy-1,4-benzoquinol methylase
MKLPIGYSNPARYYGILEQNGKYDGNAIMKNRVIGKILKKYGVKTVLDLACGQGSQVFWLVAQGYKVTGVDLSPAMLKFAKLRARKERVNVKLIEGDMRTVKVGRFDAVITIFNAVGHLTKAEFEKTIRNVRDNLNDGGLYVFDILNLNGRKSITRNEHLWNAGDAMLRSVQVQKLNRKNGHLLTYECFYKQKNPGKFNLFKQHRYILKIYDAKQLKEMLVRNGFEVFEQYHVDGATFLNNKNGSILTIAKRPYK